MGGMKTPELREGAPQFEIALAKREDADAIARIQHDAWLATYQNDALGITREVLEHRLGGIEARKRIWEETIATLPDNLHIETVHKDGHVIGFCKVAKGEVEHHVDALYLDPNVRKQGAGGAVFRAALTWLGDERPISLEVVDYNADAIAFYEHFGFVRVGPGKGMDMRAKDEKGNPLVMSDLIMRRPAKDEQR